MAKEPRCTLCKQLGHYKSFCFQAPRKAIAVRKPLRASIKPIKRKPITNTTKPRKPLKRAKIASQSKSERSILIREADKWFSIYIRLKDAVDGKAQCVTCPFVNEWEFMQNGHYINRRKLALRWDEMNCHCQCPMCNETLGGNLTKYEQYMVTQYGADFGYHLQQKVLNRGKVTLSDIQEIVDTYKNKVAQLI